MKKYSLVLFLLLLTITIHNKTEAGYWFSTILEKVSFQTFHKKQEEVFVPIIITQKTETNIIAPVNLEQETYLNNFLKRLNIFNKNNNHETCGIERGGIAFSINSKDGSGEKCGAKTVFSGFGQYFKKGVLGGGYVNPMLEKGMQNKAASVEKCKKSNVAKEYGEKCFGSYDLNSEGSVYVQSQLIHWQHEGELNNQNCVPIYLDNCDSIGEENYRKILDSIENINNSGKVKLKVISSNPQNNCNMFAHPVVIGSLVEEINKEDLQKVLKMRQNPKQILLFTRGGSGTNEKLEEIEKTNIPNSFYSYDSGKEYETVNRCTYHN